MKDLIAAARAVQPRAWAPYSGFRVGAALRGASGRIHVGCNVENAAFPQSQCAEASAIGAMLAAGDQRIVEVAIIGSAPEPCAPCGGCRQRLAEFADADLPVHMLGADGTLKTSTLAELLPLGFTLKLAERPNAAGAVPVDAVAIIRARAPGFTPLIGVVLGSGLGPVAEAIEPVAAIAYAELPGFPVPSVAGHAGRLVLGRLAGVPVACLQGRAHLYEGHGAGAVLPLVRTLGALGCAGLIVTNAAGSLRPEVAPGTVALITDHINLTGTSPLVGANDQAIGPRFPDLTLAYDPTWRSILAASAAALGLDLPGGVYLAVLGPAFETPAEIRAFRTLGADLVGMSTVPEVIAARHAGLRVAGLSVVTNLAAGLGSGELDHAETLVQSAAAAQELVRLLHHALPELARALG